MKEDRLRVWIDGACEPFNPGGTASYGLVVKHGQDILFEEGVVVGSGATMSNNVGEYSGLIAFLEWYLGGQISLASKGIKKVPVVYSDSALLINQMQGEWRVKKGLYVPYYLRAQEMIQRHRLELSFCWVPREENTEADEWSKKALIKAGVTLRIQPQPII